jgi:hypothetical protein
MRILAVTWTFWLLTLGAALAQSVPTEMTAADIVATYKGVVVYIAVFFKEPDGRENCETGTGFVVSANGYVVTSHHLIKPEKSESRYKSFRIAGSVGEPFSCEFPVGDIRELELVQTLTDQDAMLLKFRSDRTYDALPACRETIVRNGEEVVSLGYPKRLALSPREGLLENKEGPFGMWQFDVPLNEGNSGGPVFNKGGRLIGLVYGDTRNANDISWLVPLQHFSSLFETAQAPLVDCETSGTLGLNCDPVRVAHSVDLLNDDHSGLKSSRRPDFRDFAAEAGQSIVSWEWTPTSVNNASGPDVIVDPTKKSIHISAELTSGPVFDRYRGWLSGVLTTLQVPDDCPVAAK